MSQGEWISIKDKLPKPEKVVLVVHKNFGVQMGYLYAKARQCKNRWHVFVRHELEWAITYVSKSGDFEHLEISHWMPLPKSPKA